MSRKIPPPLALTLLILLRRAGRSQQELAAELKVKPETFSSWIRTGRGLDRMILDEAAVLLGFDVSEVERTLDYLAGKRPAEGEEIPGYTGLTPGERRIVQAARARVQQQALEALDAELPRELEEARVRRARAKAEEVWKELRSRSAEERRVYLDENPEVCTPALVRRLCDESVRAAGRSASRAMVLAELALSVAERVPGEVSLRCQGFAKGFIANAFRVGGQLPVADSVLAEAHRLWRMGTVGDPALDEARLFDLEASLRRAQRRFDESTALLERALSLSSGLGAGNILIKKSHVQHACGQYEEALETLELAAACAGPVQEPRFGLAIHFNRAANFCRLGRHQEARALLPSIWGLADSLGGENHLLRLQWLTAEVAAGLGDEETAARSLEAIRREFESQGNFFDAALAALDLAEIHLKQARWPRVRDLAAELVEIFHVQGIHREALAALLLFREAVERHEATVDLIRHLAQYLREAREDPSHRFEHRGFPPL